MNRLYDAYVTEFGPINRFTEQARTGWVLARNLDPDEIDPDWPTRQRIGQRRRAGRRSW